MTDASPPDPAKAPEGPPTRSGRLPLRWRPRRPRTPVGWVIAAVVALVLLGGAIILGARYGVLLPQTRLMIEASTSGLKLGRFGRLRIEGLDGDVWTRFTVRRLTISDDAGVWLDARGLAVHWNYGRLLRRRLDVDTLEARQVTILRRPAFDTSGVSQGMPVSVQIDMAHGRIEMLPAFSGSRGVYDLTLRDLTVPRGGGARFAVAADSILHPGDFLRVRLDLGRKKELFVQADALEAKGGAMAGALGLDSRQPFSLQARATGTLSEGKLTVVSRSGAIDPVTAQGAWNPQGGSASGRILLDSSTLTRGWVKRFGPEVQMGMVGRRQSAGVYGIDFRAAAQNLNLTASGAVQPAERLTSGLRTTAVVGDLSRLFSVPKVGQGRLSGLLVGTTGAFRLEQGQLAVTNVIDGPYRIPVAAGVAGFTFKNGELDIQAALQARGGAGGDGWQVIFLGPSPKASATVTRLRDGRFLIRSLEATGVAMRLNGTGTRGVFGDLAFKGGLELPKLAGLRKGAGGAAKATWIATQRTEQSPWNVSVEGTGQKYASGYAEVDRLLGAAPRLNAEASYIHGVTTVTKAVLTGAAGNVRATGTRAENGQLSFEGDWNAKGPFTIGPLEVTGSATGKGKVTGTLEEPKADLIADIDTLVLPRMTVHPGHVALTFLGGKDSLVGGIGLNGDSEFGPAWAKAGFRFINDGMEFKDIDADLGGVRARGVLALRSLSPSSADLTLSIGPGALLSEGRVAGALRIVDRPGGAVASARLETSGAVIRGVAMALGRGQFTADGPVSNLPYRVTARGAFNRNALGLDGGGQIVEADGRWTVSFAGSGQARAAKFQTTEPIVLRTGGGETTARMRLSLGGGVAKVDVRQTGDVLNAAAALQGVDIGFLSEDFAGRFDADLSLQGKGSRLDGVLNARLDDARSRDAGVRLGMNGQVKAVLSDDRLTVDAAVTSKEGLKSNANFVFPTESAARPFRIAIARNRPLQGRFEADGEVQPLWDLLLGGERTVSGRVVTRATIAGTFNDPKITGQASLQDGGFEDYATGLKLTKLGIQADLQTDTILVRQFGGVDGRTGTVSGTGRVNLNRGAASDFSLNLKAFRLIDNDTATANATGEVNVTRGADGRVKIAGALNIDQAQVNAAARLSSNVATMDVVEINRPDSMEGQLAPAANNALGASLDVRLSAPRRIFVKGRGLDLEMSLASRVTGSTSQPILDGTARVVRGDYQFAGKRFEFDDRGVVQLSTNPNLIRLDLSATREDPALTAVIRIAGTAAKPQISLTSAPILPDDEVLSQVLFGRSASQLSPLEAAQLASALTSLAAGGGFDVIGGLRNLAGLDRLAVAGGGGGQTAVSVAGGKYLTDKLYLELGGGGRDGSSAEVDYRVNPKLSVISRLSSQGGAKLSVRWRRDLGPKAKTKP